VVVEDEDPDNIYTFTCKGPFSIPLDDYGPAAFYIENEQLFTDQVLTYDEANQGANSRFLLIIVEDQYGHEYQEEFYIQIEKAYFGPSGIALSDSSVLENQPVGTAVGKLLVEDEDPLNTYTFTLQGPWNQGMGEYDPASFYLDNDTLRTAVVFDAEVADTSYLLIGLTDSYGNQLSRGFTIRIKPDPSGSTGIAAPVLVEDLLYPNPADLSVKLSHPERRSMLEIYEAATGRKMLVLEHVTETIDVSGLSEGLYLVVLRSAEGTMAQKLLIQH
jgi:hypothetical protein